MLMALGHHGARRFCFRVRAVVPVESVKSVLSVKGYGQRTGRGPHVRAKHRLINGETNLDGVKGALFIGPAFFL